MILKNIEQYVVQDDENQTAYLKLPATTTGGTGTAARSRPTPTT